MSAWALLVAGLISPNAPECLRDCRVSDSGIAFLQNHEGYSPFRYRDSAGYWTIGTGHKLVAGEKFKEPLMPDAATALLRKDLSHAESAINKGVDVPLQQNQFDAVASFTFNVGGGALRSSTLLKKVNAERHNEVPPQFMRWVYAGGKKIDGLKNRRKDEAELYADGSL